MGFEWELVIDWETNFAALGAYKLKHGDCRVTRKSAENRSLAKWIAHQREAHRAGNLQQDRCSRLDALGFEWDPVAADWEKNFAALGAYKAKHGRSKVPQAWSENPALGRWVAKQRVAYKAGKLPQDRRARLDALGFE